MAYTTINKSSDFFNTKLYTGNDSNSHAITGVGHQPDLIWIKSRSNATSHSLTDAVRGVGKNIKSDSSNAEFTNTNYVASFDSDGFTINDDGDINGNNRTYASWNWKANGAGSSNTDGATNTTVSVNTTAGFSIVKWTGTGNATTLGHGLNAVPKFWIIKNLEQAEDWRIYHHSLGNTKKLELNNNEAEASDISYWNNTSPTSSLMTVGSSNANNGGSRNMIAYCFAEKTGYSKFGSYVGNGSTDGTFVYTGFKPAFYLWKKSNGTSDWHIVDNKRDTGNETDVNLSPNSNSAESIGNGYNGVDFLSNGIKVRRGNSDVNGSGLTYIYMAFAAAPLVGTNNVPCTAR